MQSDGAARPMGRPRDARADRAILEATLELIAERGIHEFRTEDVAARAGVGKGVRHEYWRPSSPSAGSRAPIGGSTPAAAVRAAASLA